MPLRTNPESEESHKRDRKNAANHQNKPEQKEQSGGASVIPAFPAKCFKLTNQISVSTSAQKRQNLTSIIWGQGYTVAECTLIPSPHPDLFSQLWRKKKDISVYGCEIKFCWERNCTVRTSQQKTKTLEHQVYTPCPSQTQENGEKTRKGRWKDAVSETTCYIALKFVIETLKYVHACMATNTGLIWTTWY